jgi:rhodanese-related sulfurtransferase
MKHRIKTFYTILTASLALTLLSFTACMSMQEPTWKILKNRIRSEYPGVKQISTQKLADWLAKTDTSKPILLDVRAEEEFKVSHIQNAKRAEKKNQALEILERVDKKQPVVLYCSVGYRSSKLADELQDLGFQNIFNLEGSIFEWANQGRPVYSNDKQVAKVHPYDSKWGQLLKRELWSDSY